MAFSSNTRIGSITFDTEFQDIQNVWDGFPVDGIEVQMSMQDLYEYAGGGSNAFAVYPSGAVDMTDYEAGEAIYIACADPVEGFYLDPGALPNLGAPSASTATTIESIKYWDGEDWTSIGPHEDGSQVLRQPGWVTFARQDDVQPRQFNGSQYYAYWYRIVFYSSNAATRSINWETIFGVQYMPYFDMADLGVSNTVDVWKDRAVYSFDKYSNYLYVSKTSQPMVLNGVDYGILKAGDGRTNRITATSKYKDGLLVWQEEKGTEGGSLTYFQGSSPTTFTKTVISSTVGCMNAKCVAIVDGVMTMTGTDNVVKTLSFFLSKQGVCTCDGDTVEVISDDIQNYFDPEEEECIRFGYENEMWLSHDTSANLIRIGLVSGNSATLPNIFPVYDVTNRVWSFDVLAQPLSCLINTEAGSGDIPIIQIAGGVDDGTVYQSNYGTNDVGAAIDAYFQMELAAAGRMMHLEEVLLRAGAQNGSECSVIVLDNGEELFAKPLSLSHQKINQLVVDHRFNVNVDSKHIAIQVRQKAKDESMYLYALGVSSSIWEGV